MMIAAENQAISECERRREAATAAGAEVLGRRDEENTKFEAIERERLAKVADAERVLAEDQRELGNYEAQRRGLRDKKKDLERRQKAYLSAAEQREAEAERSPMGDTRAELRRSGEGHRREAASLDPERQDLERKTAAWQEKRVEAASLGKVVDRLAGAEQRAADRREQRETDERASRGTRPRE